MSASRQMNNYIVEIVLLTPTRRAHINWPLTFDISYTEIKFVNQSDFPPINNEVCFGEIPTLHPSDFLHSSKAYFFPIYQVLC